MSKNAIRLAIADDHDIVRVGLEAIVAQEDDVTLAGQASSGAELFELLRKVKADVLLMDVHAPGFDALTTVEQIAILYPDLRIILFTADHDRLIIQAAIRKGVAGYVLKDEPTSLNILPAIRAVADGRVWYSPGANQRIIQWMQFKLTDHEMNVLQLMAEGHTPARIAGNTQRSVNSIYQAQSRIRNKLGAQTNEEAIFIARRDGCAPKGYR